MRALRTLSLASLLLAGAAPTEPVVTTTAGPVRGAMREGAFFFGGIPFAAPPVGPRRWQAPAPAAAWRQTRDATAFGADCPQPASETRETHPQAESCLFLNVVSPDLTARKLPVLFVIHGGANFVGSGRELIDRAIPPIVKDGVVLVAANYRLGRLGFFSHPGLTSEAPRAHSNYYLMDQIAALRWVRDNIAKFGGDPGNVTVIGCSAGGSGVNGVLGSPMARGLIAKASPHSGGGLFNGDRPLARAEKEGIAFAGRVGVTAQGAKALAPLRALSVAQVMAGDKGAPDFGAVVDGTWLPQPISVAFATDRWNKAPLLVGSTSNEASVFGLMGFDRPTMEQRFDIDFAALAPAYGRLDARELLRQVQTDFIFTSGSIGLATLAANGGAPSWAYHYDHVPQAERGEQPGAPHCADFRRWFGFEGGGRTTPPSGEQDRAVTRALHNYLLNFARSGDPNGPGLPVWPRTPAGGSEPLVIGETIAAEPGFRARQLQPWFTRWEAQTGYKISPTRR
ncbi:carboxylesterase/lipase family protein [Sphingomonas jatrophae]|uniref:Carboxylic ester hydrolase n=1 Tax=Sphingomonas jatrophae TaxID=1166337 RepID=A0A1I6KCD3_9SPHN|nr:carboxylesterase family protein [Sphingomonas jatrophae]SFR88902.1 para-nitrobenzyl esterase [Sphingomonas jatrophae]